MVLKKDADPATPTPSDPAMKAEQWIDFSSGYFQRALHLFPKQGTKPPWKLYQNYARDIRLFRHAPIDDGEMVFSKRRSVSTEPLAA